FVHLYHDFDFREAEARFRKALELQPGLAMTHYWYAGLLSATGRHEAAIASIRRAQEIDPLSPLINADAGWYYFYARRYPEAIQECRRIIRLEPSYAWAHSCVIDAALQAGLDPEAREGLDELARVVSAPESLRESLRAAPTAEEARRIFSRWQLERAGERDDETYLSPFVMALSKIGAGDRPGALEGIERAYQEHDGFLVHVAVDPRLEPLRGEERFQNVLGKLGLEAE
ncbi:MAG: tetratricopeptide repeat protein, partial [Vicinamibacteria bacterium]